MKILSALFFLILSLSISEVKSYAGHGMGEIENGLSALTIKPRNIASAADDSSRMVFSGNTLYVIGRYFGRHEVANMQLVNRAFYKSINDNQMLWKKYYSALQLENSHISPDYKTLVKTYFKPTLLIMEKSNNYKSFIPFALSPDKTFMVGVAIVKDNSRRRAAKLIVQSGAIETLGLLNNGRKSLALNANFDGSVVIGYASDGSNRNIATAFRCVKGGPLESLGLLNDGNSSRALHTNFDGSEIIGIANDGKNKNTPTLVKWINGSIQKLAAINGKKVFHALNANFNGSIVVGYATHGRIANSEVAFKYVKGVTHWLNSLPRAQPSYLLNTGARPAYALHTNFDGSVIGGWANDGNNKAQIAVLWDSKGNIQSLDCYFRKLNLLSNSQYLKSVNGLSPDGSAIIGVTSDEKIFIAHKPRSGLFIMQP